MENILINGEYILFDDEEGLVVTNKRIIMIEADNIQTDYHCYPLSNITKFIIKSSQSYEELIIKLKDLNILYSYGKSKKNKHYIDYIYNLYIISILYRK